MATTAQIKYAVDFWLDKMRKVRLDNAPLSTEVLDQFRRSLTKVIKNDTDIRAVVCSFAPQSTLLAALKEIKTKDSPGKKDNLSENKPPILVDDVDLIFNPDGSIDLRDADQNDGVWQHIPL